MLVFNSSSNKATVGEINHKYCTCSLTVLQMAPKLIFCFQHLLVSFLFRWPITWKKIRKTSGLIWVIVYSCLLNNFFNTLNHRRHNAQHNHILNHTVSPHGPQAAPPPTHLGQEEDRRAPCSEFSGFRGGYTQQHGDVVGRGQPRSAVRHHDGSSHIGGSPAGQEKSTVGHLCLVACSLQRNGPERTSSLASGTTWGSERKKIHDQILTLLYYMSGVPHVFYPLL